MWQLQQPWPGSSQSHTARVQSQKRKKAKNCSFHFNFLRRVEVRGKSKTGRPQDKSRLCFLSNLAYTGGTPALRDLSGVITPLDSRALQTQITYPYTTHRNPAAAAPAKNDFFFLGISYNLDLLVPSGPLARLEGGKKLEENYDNCYGVAEPPRPSAGTFSPREQNREGDLELPTLKVKT